jgi:hypothetical protein
MTSSERQAWLTPAIIAGVLYSAIGILFGLPTTHARAWRLAAWLASGAIYAAHIGYEHFRLRNPAYKTALHVALAVALGAFGLALAASAHELWVAPVYRRSLAIAFVAWPAITAVPAFLVALAIAYLLKLMKLNVSQAA